MNLTSASRLPSAATAVLACLLTACQQTPEQQAPTRAPEVTVATPLVKNVTDWDIYTGRLEAVDYVEVRARVSGYLESAAFEEGTLIDKGDLLYEIDPRPYEAVLAEASAELTRSQVRLELAQNDLDRAKRLFESRAVSEEELDARTQEQRQAVAALEAARAAVSAASLNVEFTHVRAPIAGRVGRKRVTEGNLVAAGADGATLLTTIVSLDPIYVYFSADERAYLRYLRLDAQGKRRSGRVAQHPVLLQLADEEGFPHEGHLDFVDNVVDEATGTMQGRAIFANPDGLLTPGLFARVKLIGVGPYEALLVPDAALANDQSQRFVYVVGADDVALRRTIEEGRRVGSLRIVLSGLSADDRVVIAGLQRVRAGSPVTVQTGRIEDPGDTHAVTARNDGS